MGYAKLFSSIVHSTIWRESAPTKVVWITMLAMADRTGVVEASVPGLADAAKVTVDECRHALERLASPDPDSRTKDYEGRRVEEIDGGWLILNYEKHRQKRDMDEVREKARERSRRYRAAHAPTAPSRTPSRDVTQRHAPSRAVTLAAKPAPEAEPESVGSRSVVPPITSSTENPPFAALARRVAVEAEVMSWPREACTLWDQRFQGRGAYGKIASDLKPLVTRHGWDVVRKAWIRYLAAAEASYASSSRFSQTFGKWAGLAPDPPEKHDITAHNVRAAQEALANPPDLAGLGSVVKSMPPGRAR